MKYYQKVYNLYLIGFIITLSLWLASKPSPSAIFAFPILALAQITALLAAFLVGINFTLSARLNPISNFLGGLDKTLKQHALTGKLAFTLMLTHPTLLLIDAIPNMPLIRQYTLNLSFLPYTYGKIALALFITLIALTIFVRLPFHIWRQTHRLMILPLFFLSLHVATISSDVSRFLPLKLWILGTLTAGFAAYFYKIFLYPFIAPKYKYQIAKITPKGNITEIVMKPTGPKLHFLAGQFVFAIFKSKGVTTEEHPFSISSSPKDDLLRISAKISGDFTSTLPKLKTGDMATLYGPYGQFTQKAVLSKKDLILIAGGIGITPFLSLTNYYAKTKSKKRIDIFYTIKEAKDNVYRSELESLSKKPNITLHTHISSQKGRLSVQNVTKLTDNFKDTLILLCGPKSMMDSLAKQLVSSGVNRKNISYEDFNIK